jgi:hypothetical protein
MATKSTPKKRSTKVAPIPTPIPTSTPMAPPTRAEQFSEAFTNLESQLLSHLGAAGAFFRAIGVWVSDFAQRHKRQRTFFVWILPVLLIAALFWTDPDADKATTTLYLQRLLTMVLAVVLGHYGDKALFDYPEADRQTLLMNVRKGGPAALPAAIAFCGRVAVFIVLVLVFASVARAQDVRTFVPANCKEVAKLLGAEQRRFWPAMPRPEMLAALAEQESCVSLKSSRCCNTTAQLKTSREEGASFLQITRAYRTDGTQRFDALEEMRQRHPVLKDWSWENVYRRPDLSARALVLKYQDGFRFHSRYIHDAVLALDFTDAGYNGGDGGVMSDRRLCGQVHGCEPAVWFQNTDATCTKSKQPLYGKRTACDINREHVLMVSRVRAEKYRGLV